jgi:hypothetical protein
MTGPDGNQKVSTQELAKIRQLADFDLIMLISEIHDHGWGVARRTLAMMPEVRCEVPPAPTRGLA